MRKLLCVTALFSALSISGCGSSTETTHLTATSSTNSPRNIVDSGKKGPSGGDISSFQNPLSIEGSDDKASLEGVAITVPPGVSDHAERRFSLVQFSLPKGTIISNGIYTLDSPQGKQPSKEGITRAITGGTGDYRSASGEVTATPQAGGKIKFEFTIDLPS